MTETKDSGSVAMAKRDFGSELAAVEAKRHATAQKPYRRVVAEEVAGGTDRSITEVAKITFAAGKTIGDFERDVALGKEIEAMKRQIAIEVELLAKPPPTLEQVSAARAAREVSRPTVAFGTADAEAVAAHQALIEGARRLANERASHFQAEDRLRKLRVQLERVVRQFEAL